MEKLRREADAIITAGISAVLPDEAVKKAMKEKIIYKMLIVSTSASIITLTVNEPNSLINTESLNGLKEKKKDPTVCCL